MEGEVTVFIGREYISTGKFYRKITMKEMNQIVSLMDFTVVSSANQSLVVTPLADARAAPQL
jgi:cytidylate kinase